MRVRFGLLLVSLMGAALTGCTATRVIELADSSTSTYTEINQRARKSPAQIRLRNGAAIEVRSLHVAPDTTTWFGTNGRMQGVATSSVESVRFSSKSRGTGALQGVALGVVTSAALGGIAYLTYDEDPFCTQSCSQEDAAVRVTTGAAAFVLPLGLITGALIGQKRNVRYALAPTEPYTPPEPVAAREPATEPAAEPVRLPSTEPVREPDPVREPVSEPDREPASEAVQEPVAEPAQEPVAEPVQEPVTEEPVREPVQASVDEPEQESQAFAPYYAWVVASTTNPDEASTIHGRYAGRALSSRILSSRVGDRLYYRVALGHYTTSRTAIQARADLPPDAPSDAWLFRVEELSSVVTGTRRDSETTAGRGAAPTSASTAGPGPFSPFYAWVVASTTNPAEASTIRDRYAGRGVPSRVVSAMVRGRRYYRVALGHYPTNRAATQARADLPSDAPADTWLLHITEAPNP